MSESLGSSAIVVALSLKSVVLGARDLVDIVGLLMSEEGDYGSEHSESDLVVPQQSVAEVSPDGRFERVSPN